MDETVPELEPPETPDYYANLGLQQTATLSELKRAHHSLAKKHHPDKQGLGACADAHEFRKIREAFEFLRDTSKRSIYDRHYPQLQQAWAQYYTFRDIVLENERIRQAKETAQQMRAAEERERRKEEEEEEEKKTRRRAEEERLAREEEERKRIKEQKEALAQKRSQEVARRARERQERVARERLRMEKEREAERRSEEAAKRARQDQEVAAEERLKTILREEKHNAIRENWARMRDAAELRQIETAQSETQGLTECSHPYLGWPRKSGKVHCAFCWVFCKRFSFQCPQCHISACQACKSKRCMY
ncbi:hypothetical protein BCR34DRAFT_588709 [Clohesyomyces aquaticus]|uniref:J domain-containing protein n=1 Tax=Clohesyomyces aquaticus TaxID=1231657 RepID=A0A1Y1ZJ06_9PLEO|nr:hypothetical protein BCR34DRAFT_588709 [Clohesyomyces aquaticus]